MALVDVTKCCVDSIRQISEHIEDATLYIDSGCTESFQFIGAFPVLLELGVRAVCSLENMCALDAVVDWNSNFGATRKIVVMTSRLLSDAHRYIVRCLSTHHSVCDCAIFTSISEIAHSAYPDSPLGPDAFHEYKSLLLQDYEELLKKSNTKSGKSEDDNFLEKLTFDDDGWSRLTSSEVDIPNLEARSAGKDLYEDNPIGLMEDVRQKLAVSVHHFPMILCPFSPRMFVLPSEGSIAEACLSNEHEDSLCPGLPPISSGSFSDGDDIPPGATLTANFLYHLAAKMDLKMEIFSLGDLSKTVGKILTDMSSLYDVGRRKRPAGLLLVDRTFDLLTPCCHGDSLVDRIFSSLPRRKRTTSYTHTKGSQSQVKLGPSHIQRPPIDVHIPIVNILSIEDLEREDSQVSQNVEAFLRGWDAYNQSSQVVNLVDLGNKVHTEKSLSSEIQLLSGSFVSTENFCGTPYMKALLDRRTKDGAVLIKKWLQETVRGENLTVNVRTRPGSATKSELQPMIKALAQSQSSFLRNKGIIQLAAAALGTLEESHSARWDAFISAEKMLHVSAGDTSQSLAAQIGDLINKSLVGSQGQKNGKPESSQGLLSFKDALLLMFTGYVLAGENFPTSGSGGPFSWQEEHFLKEAIVDAFLENPSAARLKFLHGLTEELEANLSRMKSEETKEASSDQLDIDDFDDDQWGKWGDEDADNDDKKDQAYDDMQLKLELRDRVDNLFRFFHKVSDLKRRNIQLREGPLGSEINFSGDSYTSKGLLYKLLTKVLGKHDVPGLEYHSSTVGRLFKSGFGRFGLGQAKPSLADQNVILIFVIGGINGLEVREALEALSESGRPDMQLIIGGTTLLTPDDMFDLLLGDST
ncbi:sec1 family domain-containing protein MIP3-like [Pistacia vera]|uniref:sec1 family domain-containing protein MIP3-like n=1 Tax=Pistacia vera TaxID=55513 RepID=UPI001263955B|nr:sec1 family domain-containing protein MIP3-like [Pistacia vera]XP_031273798.1 sec1 family domain-containing protein MIP3-like [Pistacia vera]